MLTEEQKQWIEANREQALIRLREKKERERLEAASSPQPPASLFPPKAPSAPVVRRVTLFSAPSSMLPSVSSQKSQPERPAAPPTTPPKRTGEMASGGALTTKEPQLSAPVFTSPRPLAPPPQSSAPSTGKEAPPTMVEPKAEALKVESVVDHHVEGAEDPSVLSASQARLALFSRTQKKRPAPEPLSGDTKRVKSEERFQWLEGVRDAKGRTAGDPEYDPRTLFIPRQAWDRFTPFERQYWKVKSIHFDSVVFFQKGKFYELYENDADIGHQVFDLKMTERVNMRMVGVPVSKFDFWAAQFLAKGYRIAKCDERETALGKALRERETGAKGERVIDRTLSKILTVGTLMHSDILTEDMASYCLSLKEWRDSELGCKLGVCFVDASTAEFNLALLHDDRERTQLETLLVQLRPKEILYERGPLSKKTVAIIKNNSPDADVIALDTKTEFLNEDTARQQLESYFKNGPLPEIFGELKGPDDGLLMSAFGGLLWYLRSLNIDKELMEQGTFRRYEPLEDSSTLILDGQTLQNLEVFSNNTTGTEEGTLMSLVNHCATPFGRRLLKQWICHPLRDVGQLNDRLDAVEDFWKIQDRGEALRGKLGKVVDLERVISRVHARSAKVADFLGVLDSFRVLEIVFGELRALAPQFKSERLRSLIAAFPLLSPELLYFETAFDRPLAKKEGIVVPMEGADETYDALCEKITQIEAQLEKHLGEQRAALGVKVNFRHTVNEPYQLEVEKNVKVPPTFRVKSTTQKFQRYWSPLIEGVVPFLFETKERRNQFQQTFLTRLFDRFNASRIWGLAVKIAGEVDCLLSLSVTSHILQPACRPEFVSSEEGFVEATGMRHPCVHLGPGSDFIPNDLALGVAHHRTILLTGPNMGGKSTLLRQTCVAVILAQLGCHVPATSFRLAPVDRIFTRIGANDNILAGQSTFMVELDETAKILRHAGPRSLVILDELGRGTSTHDGFAIAYAVLRHLVTHTRCLALFSTHYHLLPEDFVVYPSVGLYHMAFELDQDQRRVVFLFKLRAGAAASSHGMNVATMAGVNQAIVAHAERLSAEFHRKTFAARKQGDEGLPLTQAADFAELFALAAKEVLAPGDRLLLSALKGTMGRV